MRALATLPRRLLLRGIAIAAFSLNALWTHVDVDIDIGVGVVVGCSERVSLAGVGVGGEQVVDSNWILH